MSTNDDAKRPSAVDLLRPAVRAMPGYTPGEQITELVKLNTNEGAFPPSPRVMATLAAVASDALRLYPDPVSARLRAAAAARYGVSAEQILAGNGSDDCLTIIYRGFLDPGARISCPWPTYGLYDTLASLQGAELVRVAFRQNGRRWELPADLARQRAKMIILANPNNPSGTLIPVEDLRRLCDAAAGAAGAGAAAAPGALVVVDEAYVDFALGAGVDASMLPYLGQHPNLIVLRTMSKSYSLAGARLGLLFAAPPLVTELMKVKDSYNVNALTQAIGVAALEDRSYHEECVRRTLDQRARLERELETLGWTWPESAANFLLCEIGGRAERLYDELKQEGLLVRWWKAPELRTKIRISVGNHEENDHLIAALKRLA